MSEHPPAKPPSDSVSPPLPPLTAPRHQGQAAYPPPRDPAAKTGGGGCGKVAVGCGVAALVLLLLLAIGGWYVARNFKSLATNLVTGKVTQAVRDSNLPDEQKQRIVARVESLAEEFKQGRLSMDQLTQVGEVVMQGPILHVGAVYGFDVAYLTRSGLSEADKQSGRRALERLARGVYEKRIAVEAVEEVTLPVTTQQADGSREFVRNATDDQVREVLVRAKGRADAAGVPDEPFEIDLAEAFDRAVAEALKP